MQIKLEIPDDLAATLAPSGQDPARIEAIQILEPLFQRVLIPETAAAELREAAAPEDVRAWLADPPPWLEISKGAPSIRN